MTTDLEQQDWFRQARTLSTAEVSDALDFFGLPGSALATTGTARSKGMADVPTMKELGYLSFVTENWYGVFAPAKTPANLVKRLNEDLNKVLKSAEVAASLSKMGSSEVAGSAEQFAQFIVKELPYWESLVKRSGATVD